MTIRVLVADDQALVRGSFRILVSTAPDLTPVGEARPASRPSSSRGARNPTWC